MRRSDLFADEYVQETVNAPGKMSAGTRIMSDLYDFLLMVVYQHLMQTFHCFDPESRQTKIVPLVARLVTFEVAEERRPDEKTNVHFIGSQIVQSLLHFGKPIKVVTSLLEMDTGDLKDLMCDPVGSHIVDAFVDAEFVGEKSREKMFHKLAGSYFALATSKHGSRALDALWKVANIKMRMTIGEELLQKEAALSSNMFGRIIMDRYALPLLKKQKGDWKDQQEKEGKKKRLFADIIEPLGNVLSILIESFNLH